MKIFILLTLLALTGCVGTVKDLAVEDSQIFSKFDGTFNGVVYGKAVSHSKVQLFFNPATGGSGEFSYVVYLDGNFNNSIAALAASDVQINSEGYATMLVPGLPASGKTYSFTVRAVDLATGEQDTNTKTVTVTTFDEVHPDFNGVLKVENISGIAGQTQLKVSWNKAKAGAVAGGGFGGNPYDISSYVIYFATSEQNVFNENISTINDPNQTQFTITGLNPNTTYYFAVRARDIQTPAKIEQNEIIKSAKTRSNQPIIFAGLTSVTVPTSILGYNQFTANWVHGTGSFDRYKIFYTTDPNLVIDPQTHPASQTLTITDLSASPTAYVFVPFPNTKYRVAAAACSDNACTQHAGADVVREVTTSPPVASFNGITSIATGEGASLVDTIQLSWVSPDLSTGAYDGIRIYLVDGNNQTILPITSGAFVSTGPSSTGATIKGLTEGSTYCFLAKAYVNDPSYPATMSYPGGREDANSNVRCLTLQYQQPIFTGINSSCTNISTNTMRVSWTPAVGVFDNYALYYRLGNSSQFVWSEALAGNPAYTKVNINASQSSYFLPNLNPGQTYSIGVKTVFNHPNGTDIYYSNSNANVSCTTNENKLIPQGWANIMALGPKVDGLTGNKVFESIADIGSSVKAGPSSSINVSFPVVSETENIVPATTPSQGTNASNRGIVHLTWHDFKYENGNTFCGSSCSSLGPLDGYRVYRMPYNQATHSSSVPQINDSGWQLLNSGNLAKTREIIGSKIENLASYTDYSLDLKPSTEARVFWYKVEPVISGSAAPMVSQSFPSAIFDDYVIKVIIPPDNMALVHRWIANKQTCEKLGLSIDRKNQYRCLYNGLGAKTYNISGSPTSFYDFGGHNLVDRYEMSCNFTRATDSLRRCPTGSWFVNQECVSVGKVAAYNFVPDHGAAFAEPLAFNAIPKPPALASAVGAVMYNTQGFQKIGQPGNNSTTNTLARAAILHHSLVPNSMIEVNDPLGRNMPTTCNYFNGSNWVPLHDMGSKTSGSEVWFSSNASTFSSNAANLPPLTTLTQAQMQSTCKGYSVSLNLGSQTSNSNKRLPKRTEQIIYSDWNPNLTASAISDLEVGVSAMTCLSQTNTRNGNELTTHPRGRSTEYSGESTLAFLTDNKYPTKALNSHILFRTGSETNSLSNDSSSMCQSRYGVRDAIGNVAEWSIDQAFCTTTSGCDFSFVGLDPKVIKDYQNASDQQYLFFPEAEINGPNFGVPLETLVSFAALGNTYPIYTQPNLLTFFSQSYFNPVVGLPVYCKASESSCLNASDDNTRVSLPGSTANSVVKNFNTRGDVFFFYKDIQSTTVGLIHGGFPVLGILTPTIADPHLISRGGQSLGAYSGSSVPHLTVNPMIGARCALKINEAESGSFNTSTLFE